MKSPDPKPARTLSVVDGAQLAVRLVAHAIHRTLRARITRDERIEFYGGSQGTHSLALSASTMERVLAHWDGYCEANGVKGILLRASEEDRAAELRAAVNAGAPSMAQVRALVALVEGRKVSGPMLERLAARGWAIVHREKRMSGRGGMPSLWTVIVGGRVTRAGLEIIAAHAPDKVQP